MNLLLLHQSIEQESRFSFARSSGPGGQNVNKVNTKVFISVQIKLLEGLSAVELNRIILKLTKRLDSNGLLTISVEDERSQYRNREIALHRIEAIIIDANHQDKKRIPTKPGKSAKLRRFMSKKTNSLNKKNRVVPHEED